MKIQLDIRKIKKRVFLTYLITVSLSLVLFLVVLPYRFYERDIRKAENNAIAISELIKTGFLSTMTSTQDSTKIRAFIKEFQQKYDFKFRLIRGAFVKKQHGIDEDSQNIDPLIEKVLNKGKGGKGWLPDTQLQYVTPFIADQGCGACHYDLNGEAVKAGAVLGASEIIFDLKPQKYRSIRFIGEIVVLLIFTQLLLGYILYYVVDKGILSHLESDKPHQKI